jgi:hypothetical protein
MSNDMRIKMMNSFIEEISEEIKTGKFQLLTNISPINKDDLQKYEKFLLKSISHFKVIIENKIVISTLKSSEKLRNLVLLQTIYLIKVLNISPQTSFIDLDPVTTLYFNTAYDNLKKYYFDLLDECKLQNHINNEHDNDLIFSTIQEMILHRYLFYYEKGEISAMLDYIDETFDTFLLNDKEKH